jgi:hypothetical protein
LKVSTVPLVKWRIALQKRLQLFLSCDIELSIPLSCSLVRISAQRPTVLDLGFDAFPWSPR